MADPTKINVRLPYLLSAAVLQPSKDFGPHSGSAQQHRISEVPSRDAMLRFLGFDSFYLQPHSFPAFMRPDTSAVYKLRGVLDPAAIGVLDRSGDGTLTLHPSVAGHIHIAVRSTNHKRKLDDTHETKESDAIPDDEEDEDFASPHHYPYLNAGAVPAHSVYPIGVQLRMHNIEDMAARLREDTLKTPYVDNVWPSVIRFYRPCLLLDDRPAQHYFKFIIKETDPYFSIGLFGCFRNGLSAIILALAKKLTRSAAPVVPAARKDKRARTEDPENHAHAEPVKNATATEIKNLKDILHDYIVLVALHFWSLVHSRWLEVDPNVEHLSQALPPYLFYFHHASDFKGGFGIKAKKKRGVKLEDVSDSPEIEDEETLEQCAYGRDGRGGFQPFLKRVFEYVIKRMHKLAEDSNAMAMACAKLDLSTENYKKKLDNHTQFFTTCRFKLNPVHNLAEIVNQSLGDGITIKNFIQENTTKYFAKHSNHLKMACTTTPPDVCNENSRRYINPYFWSHLTFAPDSPITDTESILRIPDDADSCALVEMNVHQACMLRRLVFCVNTNGVDAIERVLTSPSFGECIIDTGKNKTRLSGTAFYTRYISSARQPFSLAAAREHAMRPDILPFVVSPLQLRYCMQLDGEIGRPYIPLLSRDLGSLSTCDEADVLCMTTQRWLWLYRKGEKEFPLIDAAFIIQSGIAQQKPDMAASFHNTHLLNILPVLKQAGGLDVYHRTDETDIDSETVYSLLEPNAPTSTWVYRNSHHRFRAVERDTVLMILRGPVSLDQQHFHPATLWAVMRKLATSDAQAVFSYCHHMQERGLNGLRAEETKESDIRVKMEDEDQIPRSSEPIDLKERERQLILCARTLKRDVIAARQKESGQFAKCWGPNAERIPHHPERANESIYWSAQKGLLDRIALNWDGSTRPTVTGQHFAQFAQDMLDIDTPRFQFFLHRDAVCSSKDSAPVFSSKVPIPSAPIFECCKRILKQMYECYRPNTTISLDFFDKQKADIFTLCPELVPPEQNQGVPRKLGADYISIVCTATTKSLLLSEFRLFFNLKDKTDYAFWPQRTIDGFIAFLMWYYYYGFIRPLANQFPVLFPDSSLVRCAEGKTWVESLIPSDSTPTLSKTLHSLLATLSKDDLYSELLTLKERNLLVSDRAEIMMLSLGLVLRTQPDLLLEDTQKNRLAEISKLMSDLVSVRNEDRGSHGMIPTATAYATTKRLGIQTTVQKSVQQQVRFRKDVDPELLRSAYHELATTVPVEQDPMRELALPVLQAFQNFADNNEMMERVIQIVRKWASGDFRTQNPGAITVCRDLAAFLVAQRGYKKIVSTHRQAVGVSNRAGPARNP